MAQNRFDTRQTISYDALPLVGSAANATLKLILSTIDAELAKGFEDRNILLTDGGQITFTGTQVQFTENLNITLNSRIAGGAPQVISLGSSTQTFGNGDMWYAVINRTAGTATTSVASTLPAVVAANLEVFLIAKRVDAGDGTQRLYWRNGMALNAGQTVRLGASGSGSGGTGTGDDLGTLQFRASFTDGFTENATSTTSAVDSTKTTGTYNAAKALYQLSYDASKTLTGTGTAMTLSATPAYTVAVGDILVFNSQARRITVVTTQTSYTIESAFSTNPATSAATVSQVVHSKDIYGSAIDGNSISAAFAAATFSEIMVDYEDTTTVGDAIFDLNTAPVIAFSASLDNSTYSAVKVRPTNETDTVGSLTFAAAGSALYIRLFANKASGSGTVNVLGYKAFMQKAVTSASGGVLNSALCFTNGVGTPVNCSVGVSGGKTVVTTTFNMAVGVQSGSPYGSVDVLINGQLVPRFVDSTLTPDGSYVELNANQIQLNMDYSGLNISVQIIQRNQNGYDSSTDNTTAISALQTSRLKNYIINGNFDFWQRSTSFSTPATSTYTSDRFRLDYDGTIGTFVISQQVFSLGQTQVPNEPTYFMRWNQTAAGSASTLRSFRQRIESVRTLAGKTITLSFYAKADSARSVSTTIQQFFGTGGSPTATAGTTTQTANLTTAWQKFTFVFNLSSIAGTTLGTNGDDCLEIVFKLPLNTTMTIDVAQIMVNEGASAAPWAYASGGSSLLFQQELALCQRFYTKSYDIPTPPGTVISNGQVGFRAVSTNHIQWIPLPVSMRSSPVVTFYNPTTGASGTWRDGSGPSNLTVSVGGNAQSSIVGSVNASVGGNSTQGHWTAETEL